MKNKKLLSLAIISTFIAGTTFNTVLASSITQWPTLASTTPQQVSIDGTGDYQNTPVLVKDSDGNYVYYWVDYRNSIDGQIFAQKLNSSGAQQWTPGDKMIDAGTNGIGYVSPVVADTDGNTLISYSDYDGNLFVTKSDSSGNVSWTTELTDASSLGYNPNVMMDSSNNIWINWYVDDLGDTKQAIAKLNSNGDTPANWNIGGSGTHRVLLLNAADNNTPTDTALFSSMAASNGNSLLLSFLGLDGTVNVLKINDDGSFPWSFAGGKKYLSIDDSLVINKVTGTSDQSNGIYVGYEDSDNVSLKVIHVDQDGNLLSGTTAGGVEIATADGYDFYLNTFQLTADNTGSLFVGYIYSERQPDEFFPHFMVQKYDSSISAQWHAGNSIEINLGEISDPDLRYYNLLADNAGGLITAYNDYSGFGGSTRLIYAERILSNGNKDWSSVFPFPSSLELTNFEGNGSEISLVDNGCNGAVFSWTNDIYIYTQNVKSFGATCGGGGSTVPDAPTGLNGTPGDRQVALTWTAPANDGGSAITNYFVQYKLASSADWLTDSSGFGTSTTRTVRFLTNDLPYNFRVAAVNAVGTGAYTASITATPTAGGGGGGSGCTSGGNVVCGSQAIECPSLINSFGTGTDSPANFQIGDDGSRSISSSNDTSFVEANNASYFDNDNDSNYNDTTDQLSINSNTPLTCANAGKFVQLTVSATPFLNGSSQELLSYGADNEAGGASTAADYYAMLSIITNADATCDTNCTLAEGSIESNNSTKHGEENFFASATLGNSSPAAGFDDTAVLIDNDGGLNTVTLYNSSLGFEGSLTIPGLRYNLALPANPAHSGSFSSTITYTLNS